MKQTKKKIVSLSGATLLLLGVLISIGWKSVRSFPGAALSALEFPLGSPAGTTVATDSTGRIYVGSSYYERVQRYSADGRFERGWFVDTNGAVFTLHVGAGDMLEVAPARANGLLTYSSDGRFIGRATGNFYNKYIGSRAADGPYLIRGKAFARIIDIRTGNTVICSSWPRRLIDAPFPAFLYDAIGVGLIALAGYVPRRHSASPASPHLSADC